MARNRGFVGTHRRTRESSRRSTSRSAGGAIGRALEVASARRYSRRTKMVRVSCLATVVIGFGLVATCARADEAALTLEAAIDLALAKNERALKAPERVEAAVGGVDRARTAFLPTLTASGNGAWSSIADRRRPQLRRQRRPSRSISRSSTRRRFRSIARRSTRSSRSAGARSRICACSRSTPRTRSSSRSPTRAAARSLRSSGSSARRPRWTTRRRARRPASPAPTT